jgi:hypothetical protein
MRPPFVKRQTTPRSGCFAVCSAFFPWQGQRPGSWANFIAFSRGRCSRLHHTRLEVLPPWRGRWQRDVGPSSATSKHLGARIPSSSTGRLHVFWAPVSCRRGGGEPTGPRARGWDSFDMARCGRRGFSRTPQAIREHPYGRGWEGPPESTGRGMQAERRRSTWEAPEAPRCENTLGKRRSTVTGKARRMRRGRRSEPRTQRWGKPTTGGRARRKHGARKGNASRTCRTG